MLVFLTQIKKDFELNKFNYKKYYADISSDVQHTIEVFQNPHDLQAAFFNTLGLKQILT